MASDFAKCMTVASAPEIFLLHQKYLWRTRNTPGDHQKYPWGSLGVFLSTTRNNIINTTNNHFQPAPLWGEGTGGWNGGDYFNRFHTLASASVYYKSQWAPLAPHNDLMGDAEPNLNTIIQKHFHLEKDPYRRSL